MHYVFLLDTLNDLVRTHSRYSRALARVRPGFVKCVINCGIITNIYFNR